MTNIIIQTKGKEGNGQSYSGLLLASKIANQFKKELNANNVFFNKEDFMKCIKEKDNQVIVFDECPILINDNDHETKRHDFKESMGKLHVKEFDMINNNHERLHKDIVDWFNKHPEFEMVAIDNFATVYFKEKDD